MENPPKKMKTENPALPSAIEENLTRILSDGSIQFSLNLYNEIRGEQAGGEKNMVFSPFSVRMAASMLAAGAAGTTLTEMIDALKLEGFLNEAQIGAAFRQYLASFSPNNEFTSFVMANRIFVQDGFHIMLKFSQILETEYQSGACNVDFKTEPDEAARAINEWVQQQMNGVQEIISSESFSADTAVVLVNAICFKGKWKNPFDLSDTKRRGLFNLADGRIIEVPTMFQNNHFNYAFSLELRSQILQLSYKGDRFAMFIILPEEGTTLDEAQKKLNDKSLNEFMTKLAITWIDVHLPKFNVSYKRELINPLRSLNMKEVFEASTADLSKINAEPGVYLNSVVHQAFVAVDEEGTEAAATTFYDLYPCCDPPECTQFRADRPFIYFIYDLIFKQVIFLGNLDDPSSL